MPPVNMSNDMTARQPYVSTTDYSNIATLQKPGLSKKSRQIHIFPKMQRYPLISLGVLCDYGCTNTLDKQDMSVQKNEKETIKGTRNKKTGMWEVPMVTQQSENVANKILTQTYKP